MLYLHHKSVIGEACPLSWIVLGASSFALSLFECLQHMLPSSGIMSRSLENRCFVGVRTIIGQIASRLAGGDREVDGDFVLAEFGDLYLHAFISSYIEDVILKIQFSEVPY